MTSWQAKPGDVLFHGFRRDENDPRYHVFANNVLVADGHLQATSTYRRLHPANRGVVAPYEALTVHKEKEAAFERIRAEHFPRCPSRLGALFLFESHEAANAGNANFFGGQLTILEAELVNVHAIGRFDMRLLEIKEDRWDEFAHHYWSGHASTEPLWEVVLDGSIRLRGWEPYGKRLG